jgi:NurA-like 5'-3' nuclease
MEKVFNTDFTFRNIKKTLDILNKNDLISQKSPSNEIEYYGQFQNTLRRKVNLERIFENFYFSGKMKSTLGIFDESSYKLLDYTINLRYLIE